VICGSNNITPVFIYNFQIWPLIMSIAGTRLDAPYILGNEFFKIFASHIKFVETRLVILV